MRIVLQGSVILFFLFANPPAGGAGFLHNENFVVYTPAIPDQQAGQQFAHQVLSRAEDYRKQIAEEWLGEELPPSVGRTILNVSFSDTQDTGLTWAKDSPGRKFHNVYLKTSPEQALDSTLAHEMAHVVLATRYAHPHRLPAWVEEGIASRYDDAQRIRTRQSIVSWYQQTGNWPGLGAVLTAENIAASDQASYAAAASLVDYLLQLDNKETLLEFAQSGATHGWDAALTRHYKIRSVADLEKQWQRALHPSR